MLRTQRDDQIPDRDVDLPSNSYWINCTYGQYNQSGVMLRMMPDESIRGDDLSDGIDWQLSNHIHICYCLNVSDAFLEDVRSGIQKSEDAWFWCF